MAKPGPKPMPEDERKKPVALKLSPDVIQEIEKVGELNGGLKAGTVARMLFMRGLLAHRRDGKLVEPEKSIYQRPVIKVETEEKKEGKKRRA